MVFSSFKWFSGAGGNDADDVLPHSESNEYQSPLNDANDRKPNLAIVQAVIKLLYREWVFKHGLGSRKSNTMLGKILLRLDIIPLKFFVTHNIRLSRILRFCQIETEL